jgi:glycerol-3-phosphate dehydrogenase (NAD(P)+)
MTTKRAVVWGAGAWGTSLAIHLCGNGQEVALWVYEADQYEEMRAKRENPDFLPGFSLPPSMVLFHDPMEVPWPAALWLSVVPAQTTRALWRQIGPACPEGTLVISASKGIERGSLLPVSSVIEEHLPPSCKPVVALSGPSFAHGLAVGDPTAVVLGAPDLARAEAAQLLVSTPPLRAYTTHDRVGVELGGAVKNVIALACGMADGLGFGHNTIAALITRGLREIVRLGESMGADPLTFAGLSGLGDLVLTCTGGESRNRTVGQRLGRGEPLEAILSSMKMVAEGVPTTRSVADLARARSVEMPITFVVERILYDSLAPALALKELLARDLKHELV